MQTDKAQLAYLAVNWKRVPSNQSFNVKPVPNKKRNSAWKRNAK